MTEQDQYQIECEQRVKRNREVIDSGKCPMCGDPLGDGPAYRISWVEKENQGLCLCDPCAEKQDEKLWGPRK